MEVLPILHALRRNKVGAALIALQIALTLAIVSNSLFMVQQRLQWMHRPSGIDEANIFLLTNAWAVDPPDLSARIEGDLAALRSLPGVVDAGAANGYPLGGLEWHWPIGIRPNQEINTAWTAVYSVDEHGLAAYGLRLIAGRWFSPAEVGEIHNHEMKIPTAVVITPKIAKALFPMGNALGQQLYFLPSGSSRVIGIVSSAQRPSDTAGWGNPWAEYSIFVPFRYLNNGLTYVVRTKPGQQLAMMGAAPAALRDLTRQRIIQGVETFAQVRHQAERGNQATVVMLGALSTLLLTITAFGIVGLTTYWVGQRRRYIGMRRALGATRLDILRYFHTENLLIAGAGCMVGVALALAGNTWLVARLELVRMSLADVCSGAVIVLVLCQIAVLWPALRAASVPPAIATRGL
jgi:putative ABC transport system permease protein